MNVCQLVSRQGWVTEGQPKGSSAGSDPTLLNENDNKGTQRAAMACFVLPLSLLCSLNSSHTKDIVIPPLITRWRAVCLPLAPLLSPPEIKCSVVTTPSAVMKQSGGQQSPRASPHFLLRLIEYESELESPQRPFHLHSNLCVYVAANLSGPFPCSLRGLTLPKPIMSKACHQFHSLGF